MLKLSPFRFLFFAAGCAAGALVINGCQKSAASTSGSHKLTKLVIQDEKIGDGGEFGKKDPVKKGDHAVVLYSGKLANGTVFDTNEKLGGVPFAFTVDSNPPMVIKGWDQGIKGMKVGGVRNLQVPASLAYGNEERSKIPANSDLYFRIELIDNVQPGRQTDVIPNDIKVGTGPAIQPGKSKIQVEYTVKDLKGDELDYRDITVDLAKTKLIDSVMLGLTGMKQGGIRDLYLGPGVAITSPVRDPDGDPGPPGQLVHIELKKVQ